MKKTGFLAMVLVFFLTGSVQSEPGRGHLLAHRSDCHRWHSCPSDRGTYTCGDLGYCSQCPNNLYCETGRPRRGQKPELLRRGKPTHRGTTLRGYAVVTDGDTIKMGDIRLRLSGIDAPESRQLCQAEGTHYPCGKEATKALRGLVGGKIVWCRPTGAVSYRRKVASCSVDGVDIGEWMVRQGWALAYLRFSRKYVPAEEEAQREKRGIWRGQFVKPWKWRRTKRLQ